MYAIDPLTKEKFIPKRRNQKFSKRENQIVFNNNKAYKKRQEKAPFDNILESNRKILNQILGDEHKKECTLDYLLGAGFNFQFFNRSFERNGKTYQCVYYVAITPIENKKYQLIRLQ